MGASPVCLKLTITFPSLTAEAEDGIVLGIVKRDGSAQVCLHGAAFTTRHRHPGAVWNTIPQLSAPSDAPLLLSCLGRAAFLSLP
eukprot:scaffold96600_cov63-Phaeocystis_antarctica.AAC.5